jgi:hypothetical protein
MKNILRDNKFVLKSLGDKVKISDDIKAEMTNLRSQVEDTLFEEHLNAENRDIEKYKKINGRVSLLKLPDDAEIQTTYKNNLTNPHDSNDHLDIIRFFKTDLYINAKVTMSNSNNFKTKIFNDVFNKIKIFRTIQERYKLSVRRRRVRSFDLFEEYGTENCTIELIEAKTCTSKNESAKLEGEYIKQLQCVDKNIAGRTEKE